MYESLMYIMIDTAVHVHDPYNAGSRRVKQDM